MCVFVCVLMTSVYCTACLPLPHQMDTFRIKGKKLHDDPSYMSALEIVVQYEVPVLTALPEFALLIDDKWNKHAMRTHVLLSLVPNLAFIALLTASGSAVLPTVFSHSLPVNAVFLHCDKDSGFRSSLAGSGE